MSRRGVNIYKRKDGRWEGRIFYSEAETAKRKYISVYGKTYTEVKNKMSRIKIEKKVSAAGTIGEALTMWLSEQRVHWKPTTYTTYRNQTDHFIIPLLGDIAVDQVTDQLLSEFLSKITKDERGTVRSNIYLQSICSILLKALSYYKKKKQLAFIIPDNPVARTKSKRMLLPGEQDMKALEKYLLDHVSDDTCLGILVAFYTGIRIGELCALRWEDIDLNEGVICIRRNIQRVRKDAADNSRHSTQISFQTPKSETSIRNIPIPPVLFPYLKERAGRPDEYLIKGQKNPWAETRTLQYRFSGILEKCGCKPFHFHMLRHSFATRCIDKGFDVKSLSEILGHSDTQITLNLYVHSTMQRKKQLMEMFDLSLQQEGTSVFDQV